jgi:hypothetical protein
MRHMQEKINEQAGKKRGSGSVTEKGEMRQERCSKRNEKDHSLRIGESVIKNDNREAKFYLCRHLPRSVSIPCW